jgi:hypothetical protein
MTISPGIERSLPKQDRSGEGENLIEMLVDHTSKMSLWRFGPSVDRALE